jgi:drug/metabolite transporter (DMT)-like permease
MDTIDRVTHPARLLLLTGAALTGFAANSLLTRAAISGGHLDPWLFLLVRMATGAVTLWLLVRVRGQRSPATQTARGSWQMAGWLAGYAVLFTLAYTRIGAGPGALLLFGSVQLTMFAVAMVRGERLRRAQWMGVALALGGLLALTVPGLTAPHPIGAALIAGAGACWGFYSLLGRGTQDPLVVTSDNFLKAAVCVTPMAGLMLLWTQGPWSVTGLMLAAVSGAVASGMAYAAWYAVLPSLPAWRAATIQLAVPVLTAVAATLLLAEPLSSRLLTSMLLVVTGIWLTTRSR